MMQHLTRSYDVRVAPCRNCKAPVTFARSLEPSDPQDALALDAQPMPAGSVGSRRDYVVAAWNVPPDNTTFVVHWDDTPDNADEPIYRRHLCVRTGAH